MVCNKKKEHNKKTCILGCRLIFISWYIDSDLQGELILAHALSLQHFDPTAVGCGLVGRNTRGVTAWLDGYDS